MTIFAQRILSDDVIAVEPSTVHSILSTADDLADLTPLVDEIETYEDGGRWVWQLTGINALGISAAPRFTTLMDVGDERIAFSPKPDTGERATATGHLEVKADGDGTWVAIDLVATVDLPLPKMASRGVQRVMYQTMKAGGARFADNLLEHLGQPAHRGLNVRQG